MNKHLRQTIESVKLRDNWLKSEGLDGKYKTTYSLNLRISTLSELRAKAPEEIRQKHLALKSTHCDSVSVKRGSAGSQ